MAVTPFPGRAYAVVVTGFVALIGLLFWCFSVWCCYLRVLGLGVICVMVVPALFSGLWVLDFGYVAFVMGLFG